MNKELKFKILQLCSGHYLSANTPNNWYDLTEEKQHEFLADNVWEPFETYDVEFVWRCITAAARATEEFIEDTNIVIDRNFN